MPIWNVGFAQFAANAVVRKQFLYNLWNYDDDLYVKTP